MTGSELRADCAQCFGLCCVALAFARSADFAADKDAGEPCVNLDDDYRCGIHPALRERGYKGCTAFDCAGAGQKVSRATFAGTSWREADAGLMFRVFAVMRQLHELLWYLDEGHAPEAHSPEYDEVDALTRADPQTLLALDLDALRVRLRPALAPRTRTDRSGADLMGASLAGRDLRGTSFRGAYLIGADLSGASLDGADLLGADLRDASVRGADLSGARFVTQAQVNAANGDAATRLPARVTRPAHWS